MPEIAERFCGSHRSETEMTPWGPSPADSVTEETKPSSRRISARRFFTLEAGTSTSVLRARMPLRIRVRKSAIGSVMFSSLPARLDDAGNLALQRQATEAQATQLKLPHVR